MRVTRALTGVLLAASLVLATTAVAGATTDRPTGVAEVKAVKNVRLHADGSVTVAERLRCQPGWEGGEVSAQVNQGDSYVSGFAVVSVPCDNNWHQVTFDMPVGFGMLAPGNGTISSQFLVNNVESGDSAGGHDARAARIHFAR